MMLRSGIGEFYLKDVHDVEAARNEFFWAMERVSPEVIKELREHAWPLYEKAFPGQARPYKWDHPLLHLRRDATTVEPLKAELYAWANGWHLWYPDQHHLAIWALDRAVFILRLWRRSQEKIHSLPGGPIPSLKDTALKDTAEEPEPPRYDPGSERWEEYLKRLNDYRAQREAPYMAQRDGESNQPVFARNQPLKRNRSGSPLLHFEWLVRRQVRGQDWNEISQAYTDADPEGLRVIGTDTIKKGVADTASLIGLKLRN